MSLGDEKTVGGNTQDNLSEIAALDRSQAVIHFTPDGTILTANENFCKTMGYSLSEIKGRHHRMFADSAFASSPQYKEHWQKLGNGEFLAGQFQRFGKGGKEIWLQASYNPCIDQSGKVFKVVKYASDITVEKLDALKTAYEAARAQQMVEFAPTNMTLLRPCRIISWV
jgi:methyl-accepting chemotaxis protein